MRWGLIPGRRLGIKPVGFSKKAAEFKKLHKGNLLVETRRKCTDRNIPNEIR